MAKQISVKFKNTEGFSSPAKEIRDAMMAKLKDFFAKEEPQVELSPWADLAACLFFALQNTTFFKQKKVLIKLKDTVMKEGFYNFKVFFLERPELHPTFNPNWMDPWFADWHSWKK